MKLPASASVPLVPFPTIKHLKTLVNFPWRAFAKRAHLNRAFAMRPHTQPNTKFCIFKGCRTNTK